MPPPTCPFCTIASLVPPTASPQNVHTPQGLSSYVLLSTSTAIAILDIAPVSRGHALLIPRRHSATLADLGVGESAALGLWLPVLCRAVVGAVAGREDGEDGEGSVVKAWNVVQANGASAGQTVPHVHFHVIPRDASGELVGQSDITDAERRNLVLGEGPRLLLTGEDGEEISRLVRDGIAKEVGALLSVAEIVKGRADGDGFDRDLWLGGPGYGVKL